MARGRSHFATQDLVRWLIYALVVLMPAFYYTQFESSFTIPKLTLLRVVTILIVGVWAIQVIAQGRLRYRRSPLNKWLVGYAGVLGLVTLTSTYFWVSFFGDNDRFLGLPTMLNLLFLVVVVMNFFQRKRHVAMLIKLSVWTAVALSIYGLLQFKGVVGAEGWTHDPTLRVFGTFGHSNHFGAYLAFHMMLALGLLFRSRRMDHRMLYAVAMVPVLLAILATASRGAFLALLGAGVVFAAGMMIRKWEWIKAHRKPMLGGLVAVLLLVGVLHKPIINQVSQLSLTQRTVSTVQFILDGNIPDRVSWWFSSLAMMRDAPVLGHGLSTFQSVYNSYRRTDYRVPGDIQDTFTPETAHMEYLDIAATQGALGLLVYLGLLFSWTRLVWRVMRNEDANANDRILALSLWAAGLVYLLQVLMSFGMVETLVPFYIVIGLSAVLYHITSHPLSQAEQFASIRLKGAGMALATTFVSVMLVCSAWFTYRQAAAEWTLDKALDAQVEGEVALMLEEYKKTVDHMPWMTRYWEKYGDSAYSFTAADTDLEIIDFLFETAIGSYNSAYGLVQTLPHLQANLGVAYFTYAEVAEAQGSSTEAEARRELGIDFYREAVEVGVNNPIFPYNLGIIYSAMDRFDEAEHAFLHALDIRSPYQDAFYYLALVSTEQADYQSARGYIQQALQEDPSNEAVKALLQRINQERP